MSVIEAALMNTARVSFGLLAAYTVKNNCLFMAQRQVHFSFICMYLRTNCCTYFYLSLAP